MRTASQQHHIVRRQSRTKRIVRSLQVLGLGLFLVLANVGLISIYTYIRAGERVRVQAAVPATLNFQARLQQSAGGIVPDGSYSIAFTLYDDQGAGTNVWSETQSVVARNGYFNVYLGDVNTTLASLDWSQQYWLTMNVEGDGEMTPRIRLTSVPYAFRSGQADSLTNGSGTINADNIAQLAPSNIQAVNTAIAALRINQTGAGMLAQLQGDGTDVFTVDKSGNVSSSGSATFGGGSLTIGSATQTGGLIMFDDGGNTLSIQPGIQSGNLAFTFPVNYGANGECLKTNGAGLLSFGACGTGGSGSPSTLQEAYDTDNDGSDAVILLSAADDSFVLRNPTTSGTDSGYVFGIEQLASTAVDGLRITSAGSGSLGVFDATNTNGNGLSIDVASSASGQFVLSATSNNGGVQGLYVRADGRVGIGTNNPAETLDVAGGVKIGNSSNANAGTLRWTGADFEGYDGTQWVSLTSGGATAGELSVNGFYAYDAAGEVSVNTGWTDMNLDTEVREDSSYTHATDGATVTINDDGWYEITYNISVYTVDGGNSQGSAQARVMEDTGTGFTEVPGSIGYMALRSGGSDSNAAVTVVRQYSAGDIVKLQAQRSSGTVNITTRANTVGLTLKRYAEASGGSSPSNAFVQNGNSFGANAILGTTDAYGLNIITSGNTALGFAATGEATFSQGVTISQGGLSVIGNSSITGALTGLTGLTIASGGADISGGINLNASGITNAGSITGVGNNITATAGLTIASGGLGSVTLDSAGGLLELNASTWRRAAAGVTTIELNNSSDTTLSITNSDGIGVANVSVEGLISATELSGDGSGLTGLNADNITTGTVNDAWLSSNVAFLDASQTFASINTFSSGLTLGNTAATTAGTLRWTGTDFEGYDGTQWVSLTAGTGGSSAPLLEGVLAFGKVAANGTALNIDGATVTRTGTGTYTVTLDTAATSADYTVQLTVDEANATREDLHISIDNQTTSSFRVTIREGSSGASTNVLVDKIWHFIAFDPDASAGGGSGGAPSDAFVQGGNAFGTNGILGTTDSQGLDIITGGATALAFTSGGNATFSQSVAITSGGLNVTGNTSINGTLSGLTGLTVASGGASISGGLNLVNSGITNAGALSGITTINASGAINAAATTNTINGLIINSGALSGVTGINQTGNFTMSGAGSFSSGSGLVSLNGATTVAGTNTFTVSGGLTTLGGGATITGAVNINTTGAAAINIGSGSNSFSLNSSAFDVSAAGALSGITTINASGAINAATTTNTINGLIINSGALSGVTGMTFASGSLNLASGGITNAGSIAGATTISASGNINTTGVYQQNGTSGLASLNCLSGQFVGAASVRGGIVTAGSCEADQRSDLRLKENIVELNSVLDGVRELNIVNYDYRCDEESFIDMRLSCERQTGVIAQELAEVFPELVYQAEDGYYRIRQNALNFYALRAVGEIAQSIDAEGRVAAKTVATGGTLRVSENGQLQNITGLKLVSGGASIIGGIDNNGGGISEAGSILGATNVEAESIKIDATGDKALVLGVAEDERFTLFADGALSMVLNNNNAFVVADQTGTDHFSINTNGGLVRIGTAEGSDKAVLLVLDSLYIDGDPTGVNGAQYYNSFTNRFRCYEADRWLDCLSGTQKEYVISAGSQSWQQPLEATEFIGQPRTWVDLSDARDFRMIINVTQAGVVDASCTLEYRLESGETDEWQPLHDGNKLLVDETGALKGDWLALPGAAKQEVIVRVVCSGGDATSDLIVNGIRLQVR